jgi:hypothetical protein
MSHQYHNISRQTILVMARLTAIQGGLRGRILRVTDSPVSADLSQQEDVIVMGQEWCDPLGRRKHLGLLEDRKGWVGKNLAGLVLRVWMWLLKGRVSGL